MNNIPIVCKKLIEDVRVIRRPFIPSWWPGKKWVTSIKYMGENVMEEDKKYFYLQHDAEQYGAYLRHRTRVCNKCEDVRIIGPILNIKDHNYVLCAKPIDIKNGQIIREAPIRSSSAE